MNDIFLPLSTITLDIWRRILAQRRITGSDASKPSTTFVEPDQNKIILLKGCNQITNQNSRVVKPTNSYKEKELFLSHLFHIFKSRIKFQIELKEPL